MVFGLFLSSEVPGVAAMNPCNPNCYKTVRENSGQPQLKCYTSDGGSDRRVWNKVFKDSLTSGTTPYKSPSSEELMDVDIEKYTLIETTAQADNWATTLVSLLRGWVSHEQIYALYSPRRV